MNDIEQAQAEFEAAYKVYEELRTQGSSVDRILLRVKYKEYTAAAVKVAALKKSQGSR